jgi:flagellar hook assembly protein FlgD
MYVSGTINNDFATIWYMKKMISLPNSIGKGGIIDVSPNPFNPQTTFKFSLQQDSEVKLIIYDVMGREVEKIFEGRLSGGIHNYEWNAGRYNSGVYFYKLFIDQEVYTDKLILIK